MNHKVNLEVFARFDLWRRFDYQVGTLLFSFNIDLLRKLFEVHGEQLKQNNQTVMAHNLYSETLQEARTNFARVPSMGDELRWANYHRFTIDLPQIH